MFGISKFIEIEKLVEKVHNEQNNRIELKITITKRV
jgi:hypothetical protein